MISGNYGQILFMSTDSREILETLSKSDPELHPRLLQLLACRLGFKNSCSRNILSHDDSIPGSYIRSIESLERFLSENFDDRVDWFYRWWCPNILPEFVGVLFECTRIVCVGLLYICTLLTKIL